MKTNRGEVEVNNKARDCTGTTDRYALPPDAKQLGALFFVDALVV